MFVGSVSVCFHFMINLQTNEEEDQQEKDAKFRLSVSHGFEGQQLDFVWAGLQQSLWQRKRSSMESLVISFPVSHGLFQVIFNK